MIADRLKEIMSDMSVRDFAGKLGKSPSTLQEYLKGRIPPADFIVCVCEQFSVDAWWLLTGNGEMRRGEEGGEISAQEQRIVVHKPTEETLEQYFCPIKNNDKDNIDNIYRDSKELKIREVVDIMLRLDDIGKSDILGYAQKEEIIRYIENNKEEFILLLKINSQMNSPKE